jgi:hypothetical protein
LPGEIVDGCVVRADGGAEPGTHWGIGRGKFGQAGDEQPLGETGQEQCLTDAGGGDLVAEGAGDTFDQPADPQPPQVVTDLPAGRSLGV